MRITRQSVITDICLKMLKILDSLNRLKLCDLKELDSKLFRIMYGVITPEIPLILRKEKEK